MRKPHAAFMAGALFALAAPMAGSAAGPRPAPVNPHVCGVPIAAGPARTLPQVEMASLPKDDRGRPELILRVARDGDRFCYRYTLDGVAENVPPVMRVHPGDAFDVRIVNEIAGPARGATMTAKALPPCHAAAMQPMVSQSFRGYLNHMTQSAPTMMSGPKDVNMHFHGFQGPAEDENIFASTLSTSAHACEFAIDVPKSQPPGTYFYHPHAHGFADDEVAGGLAGMWIVEEKTPELPASDEHPIVFTYRIPAINDSAPIFDDAALFNASIKNTSTEPLPKVSYDPFAPPPWVSTIPLVSGATMEHSPMCGDRSGVTIAVNGVDGPATMTLPANEPQLLRLLNGTSDSIEYLHFRDEHGKVRPLQVVARDGIAVGPDVAHPLARYESSAHTEIVPAARADVLVTLAPGETLTLYSDRHCNGAFDEVQINRDLLVLRAGDPVATPAKLVSTPISPTQGSAVALERYARAHPEQIRKRAFTYTEYAFPKRRGKGAYEQYYLTETDDRNFSESPFWMTMTKAGTPKPDVIVKRGSIEEWYLFNTTLETHSFHIHQMDFVALDAPDAPARLDTVVVNPATILPERHNGYPMLKPSRTRVLLDFRNVPRGTFVFHCHMLFHEDRGMMKVIQVI